MYSCDLLILENVYNSSIDWCWTFWRLGFYFMLTFNNQILKGSNKTEYIY